MWNYWVKVCVFLRVCMYVCVCVCVCVYARVYDWILVTFLIPHSIGFQGPQVGA